MALKPGTHDEGVDHILMAEQALLGCLLVAPEIVRDLMAFAKDTDFQIDEDRRIFQAARGLFRSGKPVDPFTIREAAGSDLSQYMAQLIEVTPTAANWREYAEAARRQANLSRVRDLAEQLQACRTLDDCRGAIADLQQMVSGGHEVDAWSMAEMLEDFFKAQDPEAPVPEYVKCGLDPVDYGSFTELGDVMVIGGEPSSGKTALALMFAYHMAKRYRVGFFSLETSKEKVRDRMISHAAQIGSRDIKLRQLDDGDWKRLAAESGEIQRRDLTVLRASGMTAMEIQAVSQAYGFQIIFIDYVQLVVPELDKRTIRSEQMADVSRSFHTFAQRTGTLVVELAQLSRQEKGGWRPPDMHDLKESGQFEQDADIIYLLYRPDPNSKELDQDKNRMFSIAKNKEYMRRQWPLYFDGDKQTFSVLETERGDGFAAMRKYQSEGKAARTRNRADSRGQMRLDETPWTRRAVNTVFPQEGGTEV